MNETTYVIELANETNRTVTCAVVGVASDGSLVCFANNGQPGGVAIEGFAPGTWKHFYRSNLSIN